MHSSGADSQIMTKKRKEKNLQGVKKTDPHPSFDLLPSTNFNSVTLFLLYYIPTYIFFCFCTVS